MLAALAFSILVTPNLHRHDSNHININWITVRPGAPFPYKTANLAQAFWGGYGCRNCGGRAGDDGLFGADHDGRDQPAQVALFEGRRRVKEPALQGVGNAAGGLLLGKGLPELGNGRFDLGEQPDTFLAPFWQCSLLGLEGTCHDGSTRNGRR